MNLLGKGELYKQHSDYNAGEQHSDYNAGEKHDRKTVIVPIVDFAK